MINLRQRIRSIKIKSQPWKSIGAEIKEFPISSKCLFANYGIPIDIMEMNLKSEGWLFENENLLDVLRDEQNLKRKHLSEFTDEDDDINFGQIPNDWSEEDYIAYFGE